MNAVVYHSNSHKKINGTLFYCFEYYCFLKQYIPSIKYILLNTNIDDLNNFKQIFKEKYNVNESYYIDIINLTKFTDFVKLKIKNLLILDIHTYEKIKDFCGNIKTLRIYSNESHKYLNLKHNHIFYGFYEDYQNFNIKTRLKFYFEIHNTFEQKGNKLFVTSLNADIPYMLKTLNLHKNEVYVKNLNSHNSNLFANINKMIYWHSGNIDTNNRALVESYIHNIELNVILNGHISDSIYERHNELLKNGLLNFNIYDDILIKDFIKDCIDS